MPFRILKIKFPKGAWRKPLFYKYYVKAYNIIENNVYLNLISQFIKKIKAL